MGSIQSEIQSARDAMENDDFNSAREICIAALNCPEAKGTDRSAVKTRMEILLALSDICKHQERMFDNITYLRELTKLANSINDIEMLANGHIRIGFVFNRMGKRDRAMDKFNEAEVLTKNFKNKIQYGYVLAGKANIYWRTGENSKALELAKKVLEIGLKNEELILTAGGANILSAVLFEVGDFDEALKAAMLSVETYRNSKNKSELARALNNQGEIFKRMKDYDKAIESYNEGLSLLAEGTVKRFGYLYTNMAECQARKGDIETAMITLKNAKKNLVNSEDKYVVACMWYVTGMLEHETGNNDKGLEWLRKAENRMKELNVPHDLGVVRGEIARLYVKIGEKENASEMVSLALKDLENIGAKDLVKEINDILN